MRSASAPLPDDRSGPTRKFVIPYYTDNEDGTKERHELKYYVTANTNPDGTLREIFIKADKAGTFASGVLEAFAITFSLGLQHGVPLALLVEKLRHLSFEPSGRTGDPEFAMCSSAVDLLMAYLSKRFLPKDDRAEDR